MKIAEATLAGWIGHLNGAILATPDVHAAEAMGALLDQINLFTQQADVDARSEAANLTQPLASDTELREEGYPATARANGYLIITESEFNGHSWADNDPVYWSEYVKKCEELGLVPVEEPDWENLQRAEQPDTIDATDEVTPEEAMAAGESPWSTERRGNTYMLLKDGVAFSVFGPEERDQYVAACLRRRLTPLSERPETPDAATVLDGEGIGEEAASFDLDVVEGGAPTHEDELDMVKGFAKMIAPDEIYAADEDVSDEAAPQD